MMSPTKRILLMSMLAMICHTAWSMNNDEESRKEEAAAQHRIRMTKAGRDQKSLAKMLVLQSQKLKDLNDAEREQQEADQRIKAAEKELAAARTKCGAAMYALAKRKDELQKCNNGVTAIEHRLEDLVKENTDYVLSEFLAARYAEISDLPTVRPDVYKRAFKELNAIIALQCRTYEHDDLAVLETQLRLTSQETRNNVKNTLEEMLKEHLNPEKRAAKFEEMAEIAEIVRVPKELPATTWSLWGMLGYQS